MRPIAIDSLEDPRLDPFRALRQRNPTRFGSYFIAEGRLVVERLLASRHRTLAVLVEQGRELDLSQRVPDNVELLQLASGLIERLVGFDFHRGIMACGERSPLPQVRELLPQRLSRVAVAAYEVQDPTNLGNMIRTAAALGVTTFILGRATADPFARRVLRVSMGMSLELDFYQSAHLAEDLLWLADQHAVATLAATLRSDALCLDELQVAEPLLAVFGNEGTGLPRTIEDACRYQVRIPMSAVADSLNVAVATGIFLYELTRTRD